MGHRYRIFSTDSVGKVENILDRFDFIHLSFSDKSLLLCAEIYLNARFASTTIDECILLNLLSIDLFVYSRIIFFIEADRTTDTYSDMTQNRTMPSKFT
jgi:hypothetical protein